MAEVNDDRPPGTSTPVLEAAGLLFPLATMAFGVEHLVFARAAGTEMYPWVLGPSLWNYAFGALLIAVSVSIGIRKAVPFAAGVLGATLCVYALFHYGPRFVAHLRDPGPWTNVVGLGSPLAAACELLAMSGAAWVLAGGRTGGGFTTPGRLLFAGSLVVFGLQHFLFSRVLATLIPGWIPGHPFWEVVVGSAFLAAAAGIATDRFARLAALSLGTMFGLIVLVLHAPRIWAAARNLDEWTSAFVAVAMSGGAFILASSPSRRSSTSSAH